MLLFRVALPMGKVVRFTSPRLTWATCGHSVVVDEAVSVRWPVGFGVHLLCALGTETGGSEDHTQNIWDGIAEAP